jgi:hypothetical protein
MAAYLVGTKGTPIHAGRLSVTVSHTLDPRHRGLVVGAQVAAAGRRRPRDARVGP